MLSFFQNLVFILHAVILPKPGVYFACCHSSKTWCLFCMLSFFQNLVFILHAVILPKPGVYFACCPSSTQHKDQIFFGIRKKIGLKV
jgi:hypothetical protein